MTLPTARRQPLGRQIPAGIGALLFAIATTISACTSGGVILGTRDSSCFRVLPTARHDVGPVPRFAGVRRLPPDDLLAYMKAQHDQIGTVPAALEGGRRAAACLVAFRGRFSLGTVRRGWAPSAGPYRVAIVVVDESNARLLSTVLLRSGPTPLDFIHAYAFQR